LLSGPPPSPPVRDEQLKLLSESLATIIPTSMMIVQQGHGVCYSYNSAYYMTYVT
jgi:hypothetical protein